MSKSEEIVELVRDFRLVTVALALWLFFRGLTEEAARKALERLEARRKLRSHRLGGLKYWTLSARQARRMGLGRRRGTPVAPGAILDAYGRLLCTKLPGVLRRYTPRQFAADFPGFCAPGAGPAGYYLDSSAGRPRLGLVLVDHGQTKLKRLAGKVGQFVARRLGIPGFARRIERGGFVVLVLTTPTKREQVAAFLEDRQPEFVQARVEALDELEEVMLLTKGGR